VYPLQLSGLWARQASDVLARFTHVELTILFSDVHQGSSGVIKTKL
jgi:hypothetical protein